MLDSRGQDPVVCKESLRFEYPLRVVYEVVTIMMSATMRIHHMNAVYKIIKIMCWHNYNIAVMFRIHLLFKHVSDYNFW